MMLFSDIEFTPTVDFDVTQKKTNVWLFGATIGKQF
jgi:hypothetical protein